jgi:hypothetical protein
LLIEIAIPVECVKGYVPQKPYIFKGKGQFGVINAMHALDVLTSALAGPFKFHCHDY